MSYYCHKCNNNWSVLRTSSCGEYEHCPVCKHDLDIEYTEDNTNLVWMPLCTGTPIPYGFTSESEWKAHLLAEHLKKLGITHQQFIEEQRIECSRLEAEKQKKQIERIKAWEKKRADRIAQDELDVEEYIKNYYKK